MQSGIRPIRILGLWLVGGALLLTGALADACSCMAFPEDIDEATAIAYDRADAVFVGDVVTTKAADDSNYLDVQVDVRKSWKGVAAGSSITIRTSRSSAACGYPFRKGAYLVFANESGDAGIYTTGLCSLNLVEKAATRHIGALDAWAEPDSPPVKPDAPRKKCGR